MAHKITWFHKKRVVYLRLWGELTLDEVSTIADEMTAVIDTGEAPVHVISDALDVTSFPKSIQQLRNTIKTEGSPNSGWTVTIVSSSVIAFLTTIINQLFGIDSRSYTKWKDGLNFLGARDPSLGQLPRERPERDDL